MTLTLTSTATAGAPPARASPTPTPGWCRSPRATATASARPAGPQGRLARRRHPRGRHLRRAARGRGRVRRRPAGAHAVAPVRRRRSRSTPRSTGRVIHTVSRLDGPRRPARPPARRPVRARAHDQHAPPRHDRPRAVGGAPRLLADAGSRGLEGVALHLPLAHGAHLTEVQPADQRRRRGRAARLDTRLGQPPHRRRARPRCARRTPTSRSARGSAPTSGSATAARCG